MCAYELVTPEYIEKAVRIWQEEPHLTLEELKERFYQIPLPTLIKVLSKNHLYPRYTMTSSYEKSVMVQRADDLLEEFRDPESAAIHNKMFLDRWFQPVVSIQ